jgi:hypothetical protein
MPCGKLPASSGLLAGSTKFPTPPFLSTVTFPLEMFEVARSRSPSPLKSAAAIPDGPIPTVSGLLTGSKKSVEVANAAAASPRLSAMATMSTRGARRARPVIEVDAFSGGFPGCGSQPTLTDRRRRVEARSAGGGAFEDRGQGTRDARIEVPPGPYS